MIVASSAAVYGEGIFDVKLTEDSKTNPISPYGESKKLAEEFVINKYDLIPMLDTRKKIKKIIFYERSFFKIPKFDMKSHFLSL